MSCATRWIRHSVPVTFVSITFWASRQVWSRNASPARARHLPTAPPPAARQSPAPPPPPLPRWQHRLTACTQQYVTERRASSSVTYCSRRGLPDKCPGRRCRWGIGVAEVLRQEHATPERCESIFVRASTLCLNQGNWHVHPGTPCFSPTTPVRDKRCDGLRRRFALRGPIAARCIRHVLPTCPRQQGEPGVRGVLMEWRRMGQGARRVCQGGRGIWQGRPAGQRPWRPPCTLPYCWIMPRSRGRNWCQAVPKPHKKDDPRLQRFAQRPSMVLPRERSAQALQESSCNQKSS
jgi:hypothetical protein